MGTSTSASNVANADTSSDDDMDMELSEFKAMEYMISNCATSGGNSNTGNEDTSVSFKSTANTTTNDVATSTSKAALESLTTTVERGHSSVKEDMSLSESDLTTNISIPPANTPANISRRTLATTTNPAHNIGEEDEDTHSMEMSSISID